MGKLSDLWQELKDMDYNDPRVVEVQKEINNTEQWMIEKGYKKDGLTKFSGVAGDSPHYPHHTGFIKFGDINLLSEYNELGINYNSDGSIHTCVKCG